MRRVIHVGDTAPIIQEMDIWGNPISVPATDKWFYLSFHRFVACPFCNLRTNELIRNHANFQKSKVKIISFWPSGREKLQQFAGNEITLFPLVLDRNKRIYEAYGVTKSSFSGAIGLLKRPRLIFKAIQNKRDDIALDADPKLMPASFLISPDGIVKMAYYGKHYGDHPKIQTILSHIPKSH